MRHYDQADFESEPDKYRLFTTARVAEKIESIPDLPVGAKVRIRFWDNRKNGPRGNAVMPVYELWPAPDSDDRWLVYACALGDFGDMVSYQDLAARRDEAWSKANELPGFKGGDQGQARASKKDDAAVAAIRFALRRECESPIEFLRCWFEGDFAAIRREWPESPDGIFVGADPLSPDERASDPHGLTWALLSAAETYRAIADGCGEGVTEADRAHADAVMDRARATLEDAGASLDRASVHEVMREGLVDLPDIEGAPAGGVRAIVPEF